MPPRPVRQEPQGESIFGLVNQPERQDFEPIRMEKQHSHQNIPMKREQPSSESRGHRASSIQDAGRQIMSQGSGGGKKAGVPKANDVLTLKERQRKNYVNANVNKAVFEMQPKSLKAPQVEQYKHKNQGKVPTYLNKYAKEREDKRLQAEYDDEMSKHPPGTRLMPEDERVETLKDLKEAQGLTMRELEKLPVVAHS